MPQAGGDSGALPDEVEAGVGTGVVIVDKGLILTNLHVVAGADRITVTFSDGLEATATVVNVQPENDLAVLQAHKIPDDMIAATMRSTHDLAPGDEVLAVGDEAFTRKCLDKIGEFRRRGKTIVLVTHNMGVVSEMARRVAVMYAGEIVEMAPTTELCANMKSTEPITAP